MSRTDLNFHLTFKPEKQYLSSLLTSLETCSGMDTQEISLQTGIPTGKMSGKVEPTICYADYMDLLGKEKKSGKHILKCTPLGSCIRDEDPGLLEKLSLLLMHSMMVRPYSGAELWSYIFGNIFPKYRNRLTRKQFDKEIELQFGPNVKMAPFFGSYDDLFGPLNLLSVSDLDIELRPTKIDSDYVYLYGFVLFTYWDEWLTGSDDPFLETASPEEITADHLKLIGFRCPFGWNVKEEYRVLELLSEKKIISLNRQMIPYTVRRTEEKESLIDMLYSELC